jgi:hypothetical protein
MRQGWDDYERAAEAGPFAFGVKAILGLGLLGVIAWVVWGACFAVTGVVNEGGQVARENFGPRAALVRYEWFKDAAAQLDKKRADIRLYEGRMKRCERVTHADERERCGLWESEMLGVVASYNGLAAEYNAAMAKVNWSYANRGEVPREVQPYSTETK